ncbi:5323_t:CDS:2 [Cetraspora pellucida]|uniref:5323_t:CDS:1 n=1 Tax=Cetraspora pellucida TaxID=1433469 RepID=A0ACA9KMA8_9GLOM|nr:5323_t:CDS:2 [Cetraspora pellucida]
MYNLPVYNPYDNLILSVLDIYTCLFQENYFEKYVNMIISLWTVMQRF